MAIEAQAARRAFAPAKVNLYLHVGQAGDDGFHPISSLMVFADVGDRLEAHAASQPGLEVAGEFAATAGQMEDNLVWRVVRALGQSASGQALRLDKALPVGAGLGGGSSDAGAALRLLGSGREPQALSAIAAKLGSDVPACVAACPVIAQGRGEVLSPAPPMAPTPAVLVYPGAPCATAAVYRAYDEGVLVRSAAPAPTVALTTPAQVAELIAASRNDLEEPAGRLQPAIAQALAVLRADARTLAARMSGSGSACFAVCADEANAVTLAARIASEQPGWWVRACRLGGPWPADGGAEMNSAFTTS